MTATIIRGNWYLAVSMAPYLVMPLGNEMLQWPCQQMKKVTHWCLRTIKFSNIYCTSLILFPLFFHAYTREQMCLYPDDLQQFKEGRASRSPISLPPLHTVQRTQASKPTSPRVGSLLHPALVAS